MNTAKKILIGAGVVAVATIGGVTGGLLFEGEEPMGGPVIEAVVMPVDAKPNLDTLSADLQKLGVESKNATEIEKYMKGEKKTMSYQEKEEWIEAINKSYVMLGKPVIKNVNDDLSNKLNWLVNEAGKLK